MLANYNRIELPLGIKTHDSAGAFLLLKLDNLITWKTQSVEITGRELIFNFHTHTHTTADILTIELSQVIHAEIRTPNQHKQDAC